jgi:hypothetical protein
MAFYVKAILYILSGRKNRMKTEIPGTYKYDEYLGVRIYFFNPKNSLAYSKYFVDEMAKQITVHLESLVGISKLKRWDYDISIDDNGTVYEIEGYSYMCLNLSDKHAIWNEGT